MKVKFFNPGFIISAFALFAFLGTTVFPQAQNQNVSTPRAVSPAAEVSQVIGLTTVTVNYSRPRVTLNGVNRADGIWGQQVPYGFNVLPGGNGKENPWRAGANENTTIEFTHGVRIEGKDLPAGKYGLHMAVYEDGKTTVIFSRNHTSWGSFFYQPEEDALRVDVMSAAIPHTEVLTYSFVDMGNDYAVLALDWEKKRIPFRIDVDVNRIVVENFRKELRNFPAFFWQGFQTAANYCLNNNYNLEEALGWANTAATRNPAYGTHLTKGRLLLALDRKAEGWAEIDSAAALANKNQMNALGYTLVGMREFEKAIAFFKQNADKYPDDPNMFDSLGEAYKNAGDRENAIKSLRKSLSMNPPANVKANSEKLLRELGVEP